MYTVHHRLYNMLWQLKLPLRKNGYIFKENNFVKIILLSSEKGSTLKGKNLLPLGANSFLLE